ncbi:MKL/myocardin-like protein 1 [Bienertia sinuspersici]
MRRNYKTKLEESEKRKQELLAEIMLEEERGKELQKIVGDLLPNPKSTPVKRPAEDESVDETDVSSFDGERSDTSSIMGGLVKPTLRYGDTESFKSPWETSDDGAPLLGDDNKQNPTTPKTALQDTSEKSFNFQVA